eukprot:s2218_g10.t1
MLGLWHPSTAAAGSPETPLAFTYYVPIPVPQAVNAAADGCADLSKQDTQPTQPLLTGLARNFSAAGRDHPFVLDQIDPDPVFPLCSSSTTAMAVGFFAYKSEHLLLLEMSAPQLLQKKPRASILLEASGSCQPASVALEKIDSGDLLLRKAAFTMTQTSTEDVEHEQVHPRSPGSALAVTQAQFGRPHRGAEAGARSESAELDEGPESQSS